MAFQCQNYDIMKLLLPKADINQELKDGRTILHFAAELGQLGSIKILHNQKKGCGYEFKTVGANRRIRGRGRRSPQ